MVGIVIGVGISLLFLIATFIDRATITEEELEKRVWLFNRGLY